MIYSKVPKGNRASEGVAILIKKELKEKTQSYEYVIARIVNLRVKPERGYLSMIGVYSPEDERWKK